MVWYNRQQARRSSSGSSKVQNPVVSLSNIWCARRQFQQFDTFFDVRKICTRF
jgi:hypothetical protein